MSVIDVVRGKNLDVKLGFEMKAYDVNKNQITLSDDNVVKIYIKNLGDVSFFGEALCTTKNRMAPGKFWIMNCCMTIMGIL